VFIVLKKAPMPAAFIASLACVAIHWPSQLVCSRKPVRLVKTPRPRSRPPTTQVSQRPSRQAPRKNFVTKCSTSPTKKSCTLQKCTALAKRPTALVWYQVGPPSVRTTPEITIQARAISAVAPNR